MRVPWWLSWCECRRPSNRLRWLGSREIPQRVCCDRCLGGRWNFRARRHPLPYTDGQYAVFAVRRCRCSPNYPRVSDVDMAWSVPCDRGEVMSLMKRFMKRSGDLDTAYGASMTAKMRLFLAATGGGVGDE